MFELERVNCIRSLAISIFNVLGKTNTSEDVSILEISMWLQGISIACSEIIIILSFINKPIAGKEL